MADESTTGTATADPPAATTATPSSATPAAPPSSWHESLPDGLKGDKTLRDFKDPASLAQSYLELKKWQSGAIKIPGKDAKPEEIAAYHEKIGRPKAPSDYVLKPPEGSTVDEKRLANASVVFHRLGFTNEQAQGLAQWAWEEEQAKAAATNEGYLTELDKLADAWGKATFDRRAQLASRVIERFATAEDKKFLDETKLTNHPGLFRIFAQIGEQFAEDGIIDGRVEGVPTADQAKETIKALRAELLKTNDGPKRAELMTKLEEQYKLAYGTQEVTGPATLR